MLIRPPPIMLLALPLMFAVHGADDDLDPTKLPDGYHYDDRYDGPTGDFFLEEGFHSVGDDDWGYDSYAYDVPSAEQYSSHTGHPERPYRPRVELRGEETHADEAFVTMLSASTFDLVVREPTHDVLVAFIAPWCGHCKALAPEFARAADLLAGDFPTLVLAKFDATANEVPKGFDVSGYPTLLFVPAAAHATPQRYTGGRLAEEIVDWMKSRALSLQRQAESGRQEATTSTSD